MSWSSGGVEQQEAINEAALIGGFSSIVHPSCHDEDELDGESLAAAASSLGCIGCPVTHAAESIIDTAKEEQVVRGLLPSPLPRSANRPPAGGGAIPASDPVEGEGPLPPQVCLEFRRAAVPWEHADRHHFCQGPAR